jgi:hemerythrin
MSLIEWTSGLEIGHAQIDEDHRQLVELLNRFHAVASTRPPEAMDILDGLFAHAAAHFAREEQLMTEVGYEHQARHVKEHLHLTDELADRLASLKAGRSTHADLAGFIRDWLLEHIALTDRALAEAMAKAGALRRRGTPSGSGA